MNEITLGDYAYAIDFDSTYVYLTRYFTECTACTQYNDCKKWWSFATTSDCDFQPLGSNGLILSNTYDFDSQISASDYPEFTEAEVDSLNCLIKNLLNK